MAEPAHIFEAISVGIVAATVLGLAARRLGQPLILGYIIGGAVLGPHLGFGIIRDEASIETMSEMGLILLLFIIGLEISVPRLLQAGRTIAVTGLLQFPLCAALAWIAFPDVGTGRFDRLYVAVALSLSSTLIVVKLLFDKFEMSTFAGRVTLGILIFQDFWAIGFLAVQPNLHDPPGGAAPALARVRRRASSSPPCCSRATRCPRSSAASRGPPSSCSSPRWRGASSWPASRAASGSPRRWAR